MININNIIDRVKMKPQSMKAPALEQIYNQRCMYEQHKKKLTKIYEERKSQLGYDSSRISQFDHIKESKTKSFINKFNQTNTAIAKENLKLLGKLEKAKPSLKNSSRLSESEGSKRERSTFSYITPYTKQRMFDQEKQNMRISNRMKSMSSSLNQKNFVREYAKSQQIKNRLMRYTANESKVYLKSERYLADDQSQSMVSHDDSGLKARKDQVSETNSNKKFAIKPIIRKSMMTHYRKDDILKNKVDISTGNLAGIRQKFQSDRPNTSMDSKKNNEQEANSFFTTEPKRQKLKSFKKKVHLK